MENDLDLEVVQLLQMTAPLRGSHLRKWYLIALFHSSTIIITDSFNQAKAI